MARPKRRPKTETSKAKRRSLWPLTPRNETLERSGSLRLASPPASWDSASAAEPLTNNSPTAAMALCRALQRCDQALRSQVCIDDPPGPIGITFVASSRTKKFKLEHGPPWGDEARWALKAAPVAAHSLPAVLRKLRQKYVGAGGLA